MDTVNNAAPRRLRNIRDLDGLTIEASAELLGIPPSTYSALERGTRQGTVDAALLGYTDRRLAAVPEMSAPLHRQRASVGVKAQRSNAEQVRLAGEVMRELGAQRDLGPKVAIEQLGTPTSDADIEDMAEECRYRLKVRPDEPISNLTNAVERAGICLTPIHDDVEGTAKRVDGLSSWVEDQPTIGINPDAPGDRFRLTLGHELGHLLMHHRAEGPVEDQANLFASVLLIPTDIFLDSISADPTLSTFAAVKQQWGISIAACTYRARQLDVIDDRRYRSLQIQMSKWRRTEPGEFPSSPGHLLAKLVDTAGGPTSVAADLGIAERHINQLTEWKRPSTPGADPKHPSGHRRSQTRLTLVVNEEPSA